MTGSGKTYTMAKVIEQVQKPDVDPGAQQDAGCRLYSEIASSFPATPWSISSATTTTTSPKRIFRVPIRMWRESQINEEDRPAAVWLRPRRCSASDTVIVASVSMHLQPGQPAGLRRVVLSLRVGDMVRATIFCVWWDLLRAQRQHVAARRSAAAMCWRCSRRPRVRLRISLWGDEIEAHQRIDTLTGEILADHQRIDIYPAKHFVTPQERGRAMVDIEGA